MQILKIVFKISDLIYIYIYIYIQILTKTKYTNIKKSTIQTLKQ